MAQGGEPGGLDRRGFVKAAAASAAVPAALGGAPAALAAGGSRRRPVPPLGAGGAPTPLPVLADLARATGAGEPVCFLDLAALDRNTGVVLDVARANGWAVRPALKAFQSPRLSAYVLQRLPEPRGLLFDLAHVDPVMERAPSGTDLMLGYPPALGELEAFFARRPPRRQRRHTLRILVDSVPILEALAGAVRTTRRPLPVDVGIELDSGMGRGGVNGEGELREMLAILRAERERLRLGAVLCYDGHATLDGNVVVRRLVKEQAERTFADHLRALAEHGADLYDDATLIRNGPASSNYRNWAGSSVPNEISPGSAFLFAGYLSGFDNEGLAPAVIQAAPVHRITGDHPSVPVTGTTLPGATEEEVLLKGGGWPDHGGVQPALVHPGGMRSDTLSGGGNAWVAPKGALELGEYVLFHPHQTGDGIDYFEELVVVREGRIVRRWPTLQRH